MTKEEKERLLSRIDEEIAKISENRENFFFQVSDSKGNPTEYLEYEYEIALAMQKLGYSVTMLYIEPEEEFVGVREWMGDEYADIPHKTTSNNDVQVSAADVLFIPETYTDVMKETQKLPCRRIALVMNFANIYQAVPLGETWADYGIHEAVVPNKETEGLLKSIFPFVNTFILPPFVNQMFGKTDEPKKLIINIYAKYQQADVMRIVNGFHWKYPIYKWVSFNDMAGMTRDQVARSMRENAITVWIDEESQLSYPAFEAMKSDSILIAKVPDNIPQWMLKDGNKEIEDNGLYFIHSEDVHSLIALAVNSWITDNIPTEYFDHCHKTVEKYFSKNTAYKAYEEFATNLMAQRKSDFEIYRKECEENNTVEKDETNE